MPDIEHQYRLTGVMTALHWALTQGTSALPVARRAISAARKHQPSYLSGVDLIKRHYYESDIDPVSKLVPADLPPPLFLAVAHGNLDICRELIDAGADLNLMRGQTRCGQYRRDRDGYIARQRPAMSFAIHKRCVQVDGLGSDCMCDWTEDWTRFRGCQTVGHVAIDLGNTSILQLLVQSGLKVSEESYSPIHYAVRDGNVAAVETLLDHDSSLISSRLHGRTPMHFVQYMRPKAGRDVREGILEGMVSYLLERGAVLEAQGEEEDDISTGQTPLETTMELGHSTLRYGFWKFPLDDSQVISVQHAAQVLISLGADWTKTGVVHRRGSENILELLLELTVCVPLLGIFAGESHERPSLEVRKAWGQICKTIIAKISECLVEDNDARKRATFEAAVSSALTWLASCDSVVNHISRYATEALWELLLSTGIDPDDGTMETWKGLPIRCRQKKVGYHGFDAQVGELEGERSEWEFLLAGVKTQNSLSSSPTEGCTSERIY